MNDLGKLRDDLSGIITNDFIIDFISNSVSFDTALVSKEDTEKILNQNYEGINPKLVLLINNYLEAFLQAAMLANKKEELTENTLKDLHEKIVQGFTLGGLYRNVDISIEGSNHTPPSFIKVYDRMKKYFISLNEENNDAYYNIAFSHLQLMKIHPFLDGNGRLARIILNYQLIFYGMKPIYLSFNEKEEYFNMLEEFKVNKNIEPFIDYIKLSQK